MSQVTAMKRGSKWQYRFEAAKIDGKRQRVTKSGFATKKEALEAGNKALAEYNRSGIAFKPSEMSVSDFLDLWMDSYCKNNLKATTIHTYEKRIRLYIKPKIGMYKLCSITPSTIQEFLDDHFNSGMGRNTLTCVKGILSGAFDYAITRLQYLQYNPVSPTKLPRPEAKPKKPSKKKERLVVPPDQIEKIFARFPSGHPAYIPLQLAYRCGLRLGEAFAVQWSDIDFENRTLSVSHQVQMDDTVKLWQLSAPKYKSSRTIQLDDTMLEILDREYKKQQRAIVYYEDDYMQLLSDPDGHLNFENGEPVHMVMQREDGEFIQPRIMQHVGRVIHGKTKESAISEKWDFHSLRHTHATILLEAGVNVKEVQHRLGHKDIQTTLNIYAHLTKKMEDEAVDVLNNL